MECALREELKLTGSASDFGRAIANTVWTAEMVARGLVKVDQLVHCHVPKTAGVSFYSTFKRSMSSFHADHKDVEGDLRRLANEKPKSRVRFYTGHFRAYEVAACLEGVSLIVCPIRQPLERLVSHYNYNCSPEHTWHESFRQRFPTIEEFLENDAFSRNPMCRQLFSGFHVGPNGFETAEGQQAVFCFATQDNVSGFVSGLKRAFGINDENPRLLTKKNVTPATAKRVSIEQLSEETLAKFKKRNALDLKFFWAIKKAEQIFSNFH